MKKQLHKCPVFQLLCQDYIQFLTPPRLCLLIFSSFSVVFSSFSSYSVVFLRYFPKKEVFGRPCILFYCFSAHHHILVLRTESDLVIYGFLLYGNFIIVKRMKKQLHKCPVFQLLCQDYIQLLTPPTLSLLILPRMLGPTV